MIYRTYGELRTQLELENDLQDETFISPDELVGYFNKAIEECEAEIMKLHEDYLVTNFSPTLVAAQAEYALPPNIYIAKIRGVIFQNGSLTYEVKRVRDWRKFMEVAETNAYNPSSIYKYFIQNDAPTSTTVTNMKMVLTPPSRDVGTPIKVWYVRQLNRIPLVSAGSQAASDAIIVDVPQFYNFVLQKVKTLYLDKDSLDDRYDSALTELNVQRTLMKETLDEMIPDNDDEVEMDLTFYREHS